MALGISSWPAKFPEMLFVERVELGVWMAVNSPMRALGEGI